MNIPYDKDYPEDAVQCHSCGGLGKKSDCKTCAGRGWVDKNDPNGRKCNRRECGAPIPPDQVAVYCSNECAFEDA